jgi:hydrogenase-1 operon protein HyaE
MTLHPLVQRLIDTSGASAVDPAALDEWMARPGDHVLLFGGDPVRFPEALDVAVVLPELRAAFDSRFDIGVVPREHEDALARRFGVQRWPSLVFLRAGGYLATVSGMRDWTDYLADITRALEQPVGRAPSVGIPVVGAGAPASACH